MEMKKQRIDMKLDKFKKEEDEKLELSKKLEEEKRLEIVKEIPDDLKLKCETSKIISEKPRWRFNKGVYGVRRAMYDRDSTYPYGDYVVQLVQGYAKMAIDVFNQNQNESRKYSVVDVIRADKFADDVVCVLFTAKLDDDGAKKFKARISRCLTEGTELMDVEEIPFERDPVEILWEARKKQSLLRGLSEMEILLGRDFGGYWPIYEKKITYSYRSNTVQLVQGYANMAIGVLNQNQSNKYSVVDVIKAAKLEGNVVYVLFTAKLDDDDAKNFYAKFRNTRQMTLRAEVMDVDSSAT